MDHTFSGNSLLREASRYISDTSVLRWLLFAAATLPEDTPNFWEIVTKFAVAKGTSGPSLQPDQAKLVIDNIIFTDQHVLTNDDLLQKELAYMPYGKREHVGVVLISKKQNCAECGRKLLLRADRPSNVTLYRFLWNTSSCSLPQVLPQPQERLQFSSILWISHKRALSITL